MSSNLDKGVLHCSGNLSLNKKREHLNGYTLIDTCPVEYVEDFVGKYIEAHEEAALKNLNLFKNESKIVFFDSVALMG